MSEYKATTTNSVNCEIRPYVGIKAGSERMKVYKRCKNCVFWKSNKYDLGKCENRLSQYNGEITQGHKCVCTKHKYS